MDVENENLKFRVSDEKVSFKIGKVLRRPDDFQVNATVDVVDKVVRDLGELAYSRSNTMVEIMFYYMEIDVTGYDETVAALMGAGSHSRNPC
ncbi:MAG: hypothetical protein Q8853_02565 [Candidatus Phytoplasma australasiaticum]|nr:hypothetical protein [Candidatus Phytoplasma australasiaticum]